MQFYKTPSGKPFAFEDDHTQADVITAATAHDTTLSPITEEEYLRMIAPSLEDIKRGMKRRAKEKYRELCSADVEYSGARFQAGEQSVDAIQIALSAGAVPIDFAWYDKENNSVQMTYSELRGLMLVILTRQQTHFQQLQRYKASVSSAETANDLALIGEF